MRCVRMRGSMAALMVVALTAAAQLLESNGVVRSGERGCRTVDVHGHARIARGGDHQRVAGDLPRSTALTCRA